MLIQTFPPRRMCRVIAIRAASIWRLVTYACSTAWMPYSPNATRVPPEAAPVRCGRCCLRCATLRGISICSLLPGGSLRLRRAPGSRCRCRASGPLGTLRRGTPVAAVGPPLGTAAFPPVAATAALGRSRPVPVPVPALPGGAQRGLRRLAASPRPGGVATVDPHLHADPAEGRAGLVEAV